MIKSLIIALSLDSLVVVNKGFLDKCQSLPCDQEILKYITYEGVNNDYENIMIEI